MIMMMMMKWQAALFDGLLQARADAWLKSAKKSDKNRVKEMAGDWIMAELPWWTHFQRPTWKIAMRLRCGLLVTPAIQSDSIPTPIFTIKLEQFIYELAQFDERT